MSVPLHHSTRARRATARGVVELREFQAFRRQLVKIGRRNLGAVAPQVGKAEIIRQDHDDVGRRVVGRRLRVD